ncbi:TcaA NTF2-like domain-containing protein [Salisediminibacterium halotolerans]|uniref:TcaA NTF2-like domain-containing protein n=1 Tax=Salisediminibacterium halotolerans TaxID=517425 RepID=UPI000EB2F2BD|nr:hypothetical protein [Salisediminibacterium halotolerans]RLJ77900.1 hypothetical protein BCL39_0364 [Actinophytocola xinjiangensis]RPE88762.1 hypothetical protein EDD67_1095 [Salisediminibacterium halotolerans]TWG36877.1 hypothetical protein BCL52_0363 [Salisediminibacterium halotolerans]GEL09187.1 hypothetical protein SHA02_26030 [Salisediminibacterium halotolerans]
MKQALIKVFCLFNVLLLAVITVACNDGENFRPAENKEIEEELHSFMKSYKEEWEDSLIDQHYSVMENYFVPNSQVYHMERRRHQDLISNKKVEKLEEFKNIEIETAEDDVYRFRADERITVDGSNEQTEDVEARRYTIERRSNDLRITSIEREDEM